MTDEPRQMFIVCKPTSEAGPTLPGSKVFFCIQCGGRVWVSSAMVGVVMKGEAKPLCMPCGGRLDEGGDAEWFLHPDQETQLDALGILEYSRLVIEAMRKREPREDQ